MSKYIKVGLRYGFSDGPDAYRVTEIRPDGAVVVACDPPGECTPRVNEPPFDDFDAQVDAGEIIILA